MATKFVAKLTNAHLVGTVAFRNGLQYRYTGLRILQKGNI